MERKRKLKKNNRRELAVLSGLTSAGIGSIATLKKVGDNIDKNNSKIDEMKESHLKKVEDKYDKLSKDVENRSKEILKKIKEKKYKTGNPIADALNEFSDRQKLINAEFQLKRNIVNEKYDKIRAVNHASERLKDRIFKKGNRKIALGIGASTLAGIGVGSLVNKNLKKRNKRINEEKRNKKGK